MPHDTVGALGLALLRDVPGRRAAGCRDFGGLLRVENKADFLEVELVFLGVPE